MTDSIDDSDSIITYHYQFTFADGVEKVFTVKLNADTLDLIRAEQTPYPAWTRLSHCQCPNCPLIEAQYPHCPIAVNLIDLIDFFKYSISYEKARVTIKTNSRAYHKHTSLQEGVSALMGIYMASSGCPIMDKLRPMLRTHIPFSTAQETTYRFLSMYMLAQYFLYVRGKKPDMELKNLKSLFHDIKLVNKHVWSRFASVSTQDASLNALVVLDNLAQYAAFSLDLGVLSETECLFNAYFD